MKVFVLLLAIVFGVATTHAGRFKLPKIFGRFNNRKPDQKSTFFVKADYSTNILYTVDIIFGLIEQTPPENLKGLFRVGASNPNILQMIDSLKQSSFKITEDEISFLRTAGVDLKSSLIKRLLDNHMDPVLSSMEDIQKLEHMNLNVFNQKQRNFFIFTKRVYDFMIRNQQATLLDRESILAMIRSFIFPVDMFNHLLPKNGELSGNKLRPDSRVIDVLQKLEKAKKLLGVFLDNLPASTSQASTSQAVPRQPILRRQPAMRRPSREEYSAPQRRPSREEYSAPQRQPSGEEFSYYKSGALIPPPRFRARVHPVNTVNTVHPQPAGAYPQPAGAYPQPAGAYPQPAGAYPQPVGAYPQPVGAYPQPAGAYPQPAPRYSTMKFGREQDRRQMFS